MKRCLLRLLSVKTAKSVILKLAAAVKKQREHVIYVQIFNNNIHMMKDVIIMMTDVCPYFRLKEVGETISTS